MIPPIVLSAMRNSEASAIFVKPGMHNLPVARYLIVTASLSAGGMARRICVSCFSMRGPTRSRR